MKRITSTWPRFQVVMKKIYQGFVFIIVLFPVCLRSQSVAPFITSNVAGGYYNKSDSYFRFEWSLGELSAIQTTTSPDNSLFLTQGLLQPNTAAAVALSPYLTYFDNSEYRLFPSPTTGKFELNFSVRSSGFMTLKLTDVSGKILQVHSFKYYGWGHIEHYDIGSYGNGTYFVAATLTPDNTGSGQAFGPSRQGTFRVIKIN